MEKNDEILLTVAEKLMNVESEIKALVETIAPKSVTSPLYAMHLIRIAESAIKAGDVASGISEYLGTLYDMEGM